MTLYTFEAPGFQPVEGETFGELIQDGTNFTTYALALDASTDEAFQVTVGNIQGYTSSITIDVEWYAVNATTGNAAFEAQMAAITANTDSQDVSTDTLAAIGTANVTDAHLGTTSKRLHRCQMTMQNVDSVADGDMVVFVIRYNTGSVTMANDCAVMRVIIETS